MGLTAEIDSIPYYSLQILKATENNQTNRPSHACQ
uniref:Uncharacterized protein n=1 Tax=Rhizophora mucronata TaxID=61149 RepID=A0A2P2P2F1_RHIMU